MTHSVTSRLNLGSRDRSILDRRIRYDSSVTGLVAAGSVSGRITQPTSYATAATGRWPGGPLPGRRHYSIAQPDTLAPYRGRPGPAYRRCGPVGRASPLNTRMGPVSLAPGIAGAGDSSSGSGRAVRLSRPANRMKWKIRNLATKVTQFISK